MQIFIKFEFFCLYAQISTTMFYITLSTGIKYLIFSFLRSGNEAKTAFNSISRSIWDSCPYASWKRSRSPDQ